MAEARRFIVKGRVQGVFFRESTRRVAEELGITGHAINLSTGDVEVAAYGDRVALDRLSQWLQDGPTMALVASVHSEPLPFETRGGFTTG